MKELIVTIKEDKKKISMAISETKFNRLEILALLQQLSFLLNGQLMNFPLETKIKEHGNNCKTDV